MSEWVNADNAPEVLRFVGGQPLLGQLAVQCGYLSRARLEACLRRQRSISPPPPLGDVLVMLGGVTPEELADLLRRQREIRSFGGELPADEIRRWVGGYGLVEEVGEGSSARVWKAWDARLQRYVAVKELKEGGGFPRERFVREARAAAKVRHPHLIDVFAVGRDRGVDFIAMRYVDGQPLDRLRLKPADAVDLFVPICDAVAALHAADVIHRDIKPQNILVDRERRACLGDFGLAKDLSLRPMTSEGGVLGTPFYMSPEQAVGGAVGPASDVYGLGATLFHALTGRPPVGSESTAVDLPADIAPIVRRAMAARPQDRYAGADELGDDLRRLSAGRPTRAGSRVRNRRGLRFAAALGIGAAALLVFLSARREERYRRAYRDGMEAWMIAVRTEGEADARRALSEFEAALESEPDRPEAWLMRGRCQMLLGRGEEAAASWTEAIRCDPAFGPALLERGKFRASAYAAERLPGLSLADGRLRVRAPGPESADETRLRELGDSDLRRARTAGASDLLTADGFLAFGRGDYARARELLGEHLREYPRDGSALTLAAAADFLAGEFDAAESKLDRAIALGPLARRFKARADVRLALGRHEEAISDYSRALESDPADAAILCNRGVALHALGRYAEAVEDYTRAAGPARAYNNRGAARYALLDLEGARQDLERAIELDPFYAEAYLNLGSLSFAMNDAEAAIEHFGTAIDLDSALADAYAGRGRVLAWRGDFGLAVADLESALRARPGDAETLFALAQAYDRAGDRARALDRAKRALECGGETWNRRDRALSLLHDP